MAEDRLPWWRSASMVPTRSDKVIRRFTAISFSAVQNASSRLTLVLWPAMTMERLTTGDFIGPLQFRSGVDRYLYRLSRSWLARGPIRPSSVRALADWTPP